MSGIFISYRSDDDDFAAPLVDERLKTEFGVDHVFRDGRSLRAGTFYPPEMVDRLASSTVLLVLIGPRWLDLTDAEGRRRLDNADDFVRWEVREAIERGIRVVPVLLKDAALPTPAELPEDIRSLALWQAIRLRTREAEVDLEHLVKELVRLVPRDRLPAVPGASPGAVLHNGSQFNAPVTFHGDNVHGDKTVYGGGA